MPQLPPAQIVCIAQAVYHESKGESELGRRAVAHVVLNRSKAQKLNPCIILHQKNQFQIKFKKKYKGKSWDDAIRVAYYPGKDPTGHAQYFRSIKCHGNWGHKITTSIGNHNFYK